MTTIRQVVLDTETTGLEWTQEHRIIEIGCVELINRRPSGRHFHRYINPEREIDAGALEVHGITSEFLEDKPVFELIAEEFLAFIADAELVIHNAPFDVGFLNYEFNRLGQGEKVVDQHCRIIDTLLMARRLHPGQRNSLDALCKRYGVDNTQRTLHGALLDAEILAEVFLIMTGGQGDLGLDAEQMRQNAGEAVSVIRRLDSDRKPLKILYADTEELALHEQRVNDLAVISGNEDIW